VFTSECGIISSTQELDPFAESICGGKELKFPVPSLKSLHYVLSMANG
jgi:hypothetical protein